MNRAEGIGPVRGRLDPKALAGQLVGDEGGDIGLVFDHENPGR